MATYQNGSIRSATANSRAAAKRSAANRQCPKCGRKSALVHYSDEIMFGSICKWDDCKHSRLIDRETLQPMP